MIRFHKLKNIKPLQKFDFDTEESIDYKFTDLIETSRIELLQEVGRPVTQLKTILYYAGHILAAYQSTACVSVFRVNGPLDHTIDL